MDVLGGLKNFFLPSEEESKKRRLASFGTESKLVAGGAIVGTAAALIAAPALLGTASARLATGKALQSGAISAGKGAVTLAKTFPKTTALTAFTAPIVLTSQKGRSAIIDAPSSYNDFRINTAAFIDNPSLDAGKKVFEDSPVLSTGVVGGILLAAGVGLGAAASVGATYLNTQELKDNTNAMKGTLNAIFPTSMTSDKVASSQLLTPKTLKDDSAGNTPPIFDGTSSTNSIPAESIKKEKGVSQSQKVNVYNAPVQYNRKVYKHNHIKRRLNHGKC